MRRLCQLKYTGELSHSSVFYATWPNLQHLRQEMEQKKKCCVVLD